MEPQRCFKDHLWTCAGICWHRSPPYGRFRCFSVGFTPGDQPGYSLFPYFTKTNLRYRVESVIKYCVLHNFAYMIPQIHVWGSLMSLVIRGAQYQRAYLLRYQGIGVRVILSAGIL